MAVTNSYPQPTIPPTTSSSSLTSSDTPSHRTSLSSERTHSSDTASSHHNEHQQPQSQQSSFHSETTPDAARPDEVGLETLTQAEYETRIRKRDYAVEISRLMGRQLVAAMNKGKSGKRAKGALGEAAGEG